MKATPILVFILYPLWKFESNSQLRASRLPGIAGCLFSIHYGSLKAIHNLLHGVLGHPWVFILYPLWKFESNSQLQSVDGKPRDGCLFSIHYGSLKAIHNIVESFATLIEVFILYPLWKFESNSQLLPLRRNRTQRCLFSIHYGSLKAIHNAVMNMWKAGEVFILYSLWKFESNSQPNAVDGYMAEGVYSLSIMDV